MRSAIVVLLDISGSMTLAGFEVPLDRDAMPGRAYGDVRVKDRVVFTQKAQNSNMRGKVKSNALLVVANRSIMLATGAKMFIIFC